MTGWRRTPAITVAAVAGLVVAAVLDHRDLFAVGDNSPSAPASEPLNRGRRPRAGRGRSAPFSRRPERRGPRLPTLTDAQGARTRDFYAGPYCGANRRRTWSTTAVLSAAATTTSGRGRGRGADGAAAATTSSPRTIDRSRWRPAPPSRRMIREVHGASVAQLVASFAKPFPSPASRLGGRGRRCGHEPAHPSRRRPRRAFGARRRRRRGDRAAVPAADHHHRRPAGRHADRRGADEDDPPHGSRRPAR